jgi:hypothetical protein
LKALSEMTRDFALEFNGTQSVLDISDCIARLWKRRGVLDG